LRRHDGLRRRLQLLDHLDDGRRHGRRSLQFLARSFLERDQDAGDQKSADHEEQGDAMTPPPEPRDIAVHQEHGQEREEPKAVDLLAMFQRLLVARAR